MKSLLGFVFLMLLALSVSGQKKGVLKFIVSPGHEYRVKMDNDSIWARNYVPAEAGPHEVTVWSPGYFPVDTTLSVSANDTSAVLIYLKKKPEYSGYLRHRAATVATINRKQAPMVLATLVAAGFTTVKYVGMRKEYNQLEGFISTYGRSDLSAVVVRARNDYEVTKEEYYDKRKTVRTAALATGAGLVLTYLVIKKTRKIRLPVYEDKYKLEFETLGMRPGYEGDGMELFFGFSMKL